VTAAHGGEIANEGGGRGHRRRQQVLRGIASGRGA